MNVDMFIDMFIYIHVCVYLFVYENMCALVCVDGYVCGCVEDMRSPCTRAFAKLLTFAVRATLQTRSSIPHPSHRPASLRPATLRSQVCRTARSEEAVMAIGVDSDPSQAILEEIKGVKGVLEYTLFKVGVVFTSWLHIYYVCLLVGVQTLCVYRKVCVQYACKQCIRGRGRRERAGGTRIHARALIPPLPSAPASRRARRSCPLPKAAAAVRGGARRAGGPLPPSQEPRAARAAPRRRGARAAPRARAARCRGMARPRRARARLGRRGRAGAPARRAPPSLGRRAAPARCPGAARLRVSQRRRARGGPFAQDGESTDRLSRSIYILSSLFVPARSRRAENPTSFHAPC